MTANIDAVATSTEIKATYRRYLQSLLAVRDPKIDAALRDGDRQHADARQGAVPRGDPAVRAGASLPGPRSTKASCTRLRGLAARCPAARPTAVRPPGAGDPQGGSGRNVVVATGTGSGKTEVLPAADPRQPRPGARSAARSARRARAAALPDERARQRPDEAAAPTARRVPAHHVRPLHRRHGERPQARPGGLRRAQHR